MRALSIDDIQNFIQSYPFLYHSFKGFYTFNTFSPILLKEGEFIIFHTSSLEEAKIGHWTLLLQNNYTYEYFDSAGETFKNLPHFVSTLLQIHPVVTNTFPIQSPQSVSCGYFCLYYIVFRLLNSFMSYFEFLSSYFSSSVEKNEYNIRCFVNDYYDN